MKHKQKHNHVLDGNTTKNKKIKKINITDTFCAMRWNISKSVKVESSKLNNKICCLSMASRMTPTRVSGSDTQSYKPLLKSLLNPNNFVRFGERSWCELKG